MAMVALVAGGVVAGCTEDPVTAPAAVAAAEASTANGAGLAVYGLGQVNRAVPRPCVAPADHQFDFWVGKWNITNPAGDDAGTSVVTSELDGCLVMEDYIGPGGMEGRSLNMYDARAGQWTQTYVDNILGNFRIEGGLQGSDMVMTGSQYVYLLGQGIKHRDTRLTWTPLPDGSVHQYIDNSFDGGPLTRGFDGLYTAATDLDRAPPSTYSVCGGTFGYIPEYHQADFWVGDWTVRAENGLVLGTSQVVADLNHCLIQEDFVTPRGYQARTFMFYDLVADQWFRTFVDNAGEQVRLSGGLEGSAIVLSGQDEAPNGQPFDVRVTLAPMGADQVRQSWDVSHDGGATWTTGMVLDYQRD